MLFLSTLSLRRATETMAKLSSLSVISIHALLAESDSWYLVGVCLLFVFLSTLSLRRATWGGSRGGKTAALFLSTLSLRRATGCTRLRRCPRRYFYPRSPCGERHGSIRPHRLGRGISIHALLAESDDAPRAFLSALAYFYPRSPCGERPEGASARIRPVIYFYPRSPCGERLLLAESIYTMIQISIHALLAESD